MSSAIFNRRSIRSFTGEAVTEQDLEYILRAAMAAPSAGNQQPWEFVVIRDADILRSISGVHPYAKMLPEAGCAIVVCAVLSREKHKNFWVQDCSAAMQNLLLAVTERNLGAVWLGVYPEEDRVNGIAKLLGLPQGVVPLSIAAVGTPKDLLAPVDRYDQARIHRDRW